MKKQTLIIILAATAAVIVAIVLWGSRQSEKIPDQLASSQGGIEQSDVVLYFGQECSHCKVVEKFIADNQIEKKIIFTKKEVWHNSANNTEMLEKARECSLDTGKVGVPFLFARGKCFIGEVEVKDFLKKEAGME